LKSNAASFGANRWPPNARPSSISARKTGCSMQQTCWPNQRKNTPGSKRNSRRNWMRPAGSAGNT
jgi:hypothetical protein